MVTRDQFLRRSLITPIAVPLLALGTMRGNDSSTGISGSLLEPFLFLTVFGFIPYLWTLASRRRALSSVSGKALGEAITQLPGWMVVHYVGTMLVLGILALVVPQAAGLFNSSGCMRYFPAYAIPGVVVVFIVSYAFVAVTHLWLYILEAVGLVGEDYGVGVGSPVRKGSKVQ